MDEVIKGLEICLGANSCDGCPYHEECKKDKTHTVLLKDAIALLKEQEAELKKQQKTKERILKTITDNQLANAPRDSHYFMALDEHLQNEHRRGIYDGLQMAYEIINLYCADCERK